MQRDARAADERRAPFGVCREHRAPDADRQVDIVAARVQRPVEAAEQAERDSMRPLLVRLPQNDAELTAADPREDIDLSKFRREAGRDRAKYLVSDLMTERLVRLLKAVRISYENGRVMARPPMRG